MKPIIVVPFILAADLRRLDEEVRAVDQAVPIGFTLTSWTAGSC
jgi:hypothetical protein